jgi:hypothetical protein
MRKSGRRDDQEGKRIRIASDPLSGGVVRLIHSDAAEHC